MRKSLFTVLNAKVQKKIEMSIIKVFYVDF